MMVFKLCLILMLQISTIHSNKDDIYLKREKRRSGDESHIEATVHRTSSKSEGDEANYVNPFYASGGGSSGRSGLYSGSGLQEEEMKGESGSGEETSESIDSSLAELLKSNEKRSTDEEFPSIEEDEEDEEEDGEKTRMLKAEHHADVITDLHIPSTKSKERSLEMRRRAVESKARLSMLEDFFKLMGSEELKVTKRSATDLEDDFENDEVSFEDETPQNAEALQKKSKSQDFNEVAPGASDSSSFDKELKIRKREVDDIGDETLPNLSYKSEEKENEKVINLQNEGMDLHVEKRNVMDGDNAVRFLEEVNTENLFTKQENEMLEKITRGRRDDSLESSFGHSKDGFHELMVDGRESLPMIKMTTSPRPKRESGDSLDTISKKVVKTAVDSSKMENREAKQSEESPLLTKRGLLHSNWNTINKIRQEFNSQKKSIESVFHRIDKEKMERRNVIYDDEMDADNFMANFGHPGDHAGHPGDPVGHPGDHLKEKRYLPTDHLAMDFRPKVVRNDAPLDRIDGLVPLRNEYLENLMKKREITDSNKEFNKEINEKFTNERSKIENERVVVSKVRPETNNDNTKAYKENEARLLIGTFAKPTQVSGYWSGLGSQPIFVQKNFARSSEDRMSGSGSEESVRKPRKSGSMQKKRENRNDIKPEKIGEIMSSYFEKKSKKKKKSREGTKEEGKARSVKVKERKKRMDKEEEVNEKRTAKEKKDSSNSIVAFDELHEVVSKKQRIDNYKDTKNLKNGQLDKRIPTEGEYEDDEEDASGNESEESGEVETRKEIRSYEDDDSAEKRVSDADRGNDVIDQINNIIVKRAPYDNGYIGCYIDVLHPMRDLAVRAGIPFVTINNCRSACKRTGYYYAGLQFGYLCFCGNSYGKYDMAPDSECNYACSGDANQTCGGLWRNSIYFTAGAPIHSNEGPVPFYLPPQQQQQQRSSEANVKRSEIPQSPTTSNSTHVVLNYTRNYSSSIASNTTNKMQEQQQNRPAGIKEIQNNNSMTSNSTAKKLQAAKNTSESQNMEAKKPDSGKQKILMRFAYLHSQKHDEITPTKSPAPTPPLRIEPQTRVFKGEVKLKQKWFDEYKDKMSPKSLILAGNVEQALKNIYTNSSEQKDFLKAEVLSFREGISKTNMYATSRVIAEFALTFDQNVISPDARLFSSVHASKRLDEMPVFSKSLKVSEYRFDPNSPNQPFKVPLKEPESNEMGNNTEDDDESRKSKIAIPNLKSPMIENQNQFEKDLSISNSMQELQNYLNSEHSLPTSGNQQIGMVGAEQHKSDDRVTGGPFESETQTRVNEELSKRSSIPIPKTKQQKLPYILRLFFWKDMLARRKRQSGYERMNKGLIRGRRGGVENERTIKNAIEAKDKDDKIRKRFDNKQVPLTEESSFERRFMGKVRRKTKDLTAEKELKRSKRLDAFDDFE